MCDWETACLLCCGENGPMQNYIAAHIALFSLLSSMRFYGVFQANKRVSLILWLAVGAVT